MNENIKNIGHEIKLSFTDNKGIIIFVSLFFLLSLIAGFLFANELQSIIKPALTVFQQKITTGQVQLTTVSLYVNNITAAIVMYIGSFFLGITGLMAIFVNALLVGYYGSLYSAHSQLPLFLALLLPHGIFELPALVLSCSGGLILLKFVILFFKNLISPDYTFSDVFDPVYNSEDIDFKEKCKMSWRKNGKFVKHSLIILVVSAVLLIIAAFVEANLTHRIASLFFNI